MTEKSAHSPGRPDAGRRGPYVRLMVVSAVLGIVLMLANLVAVGRVATSGGLFEHRPRQYRVPLVPAGPGSSPPEAVIADLGRACSDCEIELSGRALIVSAPSPEMGIGPVLSVLRRHGYRWNRFSLGRDFSPEHLTRIVSDPEYLGWLLLPLPVLFLLAGLLLRKRLTGDQGGAELPGVSFPRNLVLGAGAGLLLLAIGAVIEAMTSALGFAITEQPWISHLAQTDGLPRVWLLVTVAVAAPIGEEVFFRGWMLPFLEPLGTPVAVLVTTALFAVVHLYLPALLIYFVFGLLLAALYLHTRSLVAPILAHAVNNVVALVVLTTG